MNTNYIQKIRCVKCSSEKMELRSINSKQNIIVEGLVLCLRCGTAYPIIEGVPCFLLPELRDKEIKDAERIYLNKLCDVNK